MPSKTPKKTSTRLVDPVLEMTIRKYHASKESRKQAEATENTLRDLMIKLMSPYEQEFGTDTYLVNGVKLTLVPNIGRAVL